MQLSTILSGSSSTDKTTLLLSLMALAAPMSVSAAFSCDSIVVDDQTFDLKALGGPHSVVISEHRPPAFHNTTFTLDICQSLKRADDVPEAEKCADGSRICAIKRTIPDSGDADVIDYVIPIAGELESKAPGKALEATTTAMKTAGGDGEDSQGSKWEGIRLVMNGGWFYQEGNATPRPQRAAVEFLCDSKFEGTENEFKPVDDKYETKSKRDLLARGDGDEDNSKPQPPEEIQLGDPENAALRFVSYGPAETNSEVDELKLTWRTKLACSKRDGDNNDDGGDEDSGDGDEGKSSGGIGWFAWLIIILLLGTASYLIFGSWLNYTRYGARGWDLVPHGDTIRDVPYLLKDWTRRALNTVQGSGSRGGYSAV